MTSEKRRVKREGMLEVEIVVERGGMLFFFTIHITSRRKEGGVWLLRRSEWVLVRASQRKRWRGGLEGVGSGISL